MPWGSQTQLCVPRALNNVTSLAHCSKALGNLMMNMNHLLSHLSGKCDVEVTNQHLSHPPTWIESAPVVVGETMTALSICTQNITLNIERTVAEWAIVLLLLLRFVSLLWLKLAKSTPSTHDTIRFAFRFYLNGFVSRIDHRVLFQIRQKIPCTSWSDY